MKKGIFKKSMLEYCKLILVKMKFNKRLFRKEYRKTFQYLDAAEHDELKRLLRESGNVKIGLWPSAKTELEK